MYSRASEETMTVWTADKGQRVDDPSRLALALDSEWHDVFVKLKDYIHLDYVRRVDDVLIELIKQLKVGGWAGTDYITLHAPTSEGHATPLCIGIG